jgi:ABC-2 type transport system ATP-binding protein
VIADPHQPESLPADIVLRATGLCKRYGKRQVVDGVSLEVRRGDVFGFLGPNGAGKSTTMRMLTGLVRPDAGTVELLGHDLRRRHNAALARVGAIVEAPALYPHLSADRNLEIFSLLSGGAPRERRDEVLRLVGLKGRGQDRVKNYSHGMKQRLAIAQALLPHPQLILLDEPTNGLDPGGMVEVRQLLRHLAGQEGITLFLSSHLLSEVEQVCNRVAVIDKGRVLVQGDVRELLRERTFLHIMAEPAALARQILATLEYVRQVIVQEGTLRIDAPLDSAAAINAALVHGGCRVSALVPGRQSLEEFFLGLLEKRP